MRERIAVLLDTDIGSDIDDAVALSYLLRQPLCDLVGITTVTGDVRQRAALAQIVCDAAGRDGVPIHCGRREPLVNGKGQPNVPQYETVKDRPHRLAWQENTAVDFMRKTIRHRPGEIVLLSIGPFSNVALLFALDPEIPSLLRGLVSMAGVYFPAGREWNVLCDPVASSMVYSSRRSHHLSVGLDVTMPCKMSAQEVKRRFVGEPLSTVGVMAERWFRDASVMTFHDPLTAVLMFHPEICTYKKGRVTVPLDQNEDAAGVTQFVEGEGPDQVAATVDVEAFFARYFEVFEPSL